MLSTTEPILVLGRVAQDVLKTGAHKMSRPSLTILRVISAWKECAGID